MRVIRGTSFGGPYNEDGTFRVLGLRGTPNVGKPPCEGLPSC